MPLEMYTIQPVTRENTMNWHRYRLRDFPRQLRRLAPELHNKHRCEHCRLPTEKRLRVEDGLIALLLPEFCAVWYGYSLIQQILFTYFPEHLTPWLEEHDWLYLPVSGTSLGCVRVTIPSRLLRPAHKFQPVWEGFTDHLSSTLHEELAPSGLPVQEFVNALERDAHVEHTKGLERVLMEKLLSPADTRSSGGA